MKFTEFMRQREQAALAYCQGDGSKVTALSTTSEPATFFGPDGKALQGAAAIIEAYKAGARSFGQNGSSTLQILQAAEAGDIAYWTGLQKATLEIQGKAVPMDLRITELFRRERGDWKLVHRHADLLKA